MAVYPTSQCFEKLTPKKWAEDGGRNLNYPKSKNKHLEPRTPLNVAVK